MTRIETKKASQSMTIRGAVTSIVAVIVMALTLMFGVNVSAVDQAAFIDSTTQVIVAVSAFASGIGSVFAIIGRIRATATIGEKKKLRLP